MTPDLEPCPFCGGVADIYRAIDPERDWQVCCTECWAGTQEKDTEREAVEAWNKRDTPQR